MAAANVLPALPTLRDVEAAARRIDGKTAVATLSGRNVDLSLAARVLGEP